MMTVDDLHLSNRERIWITFAPTDGGHVYEHFSFEVGITLEFADFFFLVKRKKSKQTSQSHEKQSSHKTKRKICVYKKRNLNKINNGYVLDTSQTMVMDTLIYMQIFLPKKGKYQQ